MQEGAAWISGVNFILRVVSESEISGLASGFRADPEPLLGSIIAAAALAVLAFVAFAATSVTVSTPLRSPKSTPFRNPEKNL